MKELTIYGPQKAMQLLSEAIVLYAHAAYPAGGSECAQSAREALLNTGDMLLKNYDPVTHQSRMSRRIRGHVKAAVEYYFDQQVPDTLHSEYDELTILAMLDGEKSNRREAQ